MNSRVRLWPLQMEPFTKRLRRFWRAIDTRSSLHGITSHVRAFREITGLRTSMTSARVNSLDALSNLAIQQVSTKPGAPCRLEGSHKHRLPERKKPAGTCIFELKPQNR